MVFCFFVFCFTVGNYTQAVECAKTYLLFFPDDEVMNQNLAYYTAMMGEEQARAIGPHEVRAWQGLGQLPQPRREDREQAGEGEPALLGGWGAEEEPGLVRAPCHVGHWQNKRPQQAWEYAWAFSDTSLFLELEKKSRAARQAHSSPY